jgi:hypothetical protein
MQERRSRYVMLTLSAVTTGVALTGSAALGQGPPPTPAASGPATNVPPAMVAFPPLPPSRGPVYQHQHPHQHHVHGWLGRKRCLHCNGQLPLVLPPLGTNVYTVNRTQVANNDAARLILRHYDFMDDSIELNPFGQARLDSIVAHAQRTGGPILIEWTPENPGLDMGRRALVAQQLARSGSAIPPESLIIGPDRSGRLLGVEADLVELTELSRMSAQGPPVGAGTGPGPFAGISGSQRTGNGR